MVLLGATQFVPCVIDAAWDAEMDMMMTMVVIEGGKVEGLLVEGSIQLK